MNDVGVSRLLIASGTICGRDAITAQARGTHRRSFREPSCSMGPPKTPVFSLCSYVFPLRSEEESSEAFILLGMMRLMLRRLS
ncbi:hypothetical protein Q664_07565 [Archangium violaceum Cb vi76]|uniref:Uncharacterized protein n=1 Tax=Archangium violaceum Cb vi76 TaxID=1406225 RepID=A0A084SYT3_9BACT|nr:hypothetical protein Q664_07565 [Archangium violaceum Cb vi76]